MAKIVINSKVVSKDIGKEEIKVNGIFKDNKISYYYNGNYVSILVYPKEIFLIKEDDEKKISLQFKKGKVTNTSCFIKSLDLNIKISTKTKELSISKKSFKIEYELYMNDELSDIFQYTLEWSDL